MAFSVAGLRLTGELSIEQSFHGGEADEHSGFGFDAIAEKLEFALNEPMAIGESGLAAEFGHADADPFCVR